MGEWRTLGNPCVGGSELDMATTFFSQATAVVPLPGQPGRFLFMADQWDVRDLGRSRCAPRPLGIRLQGLPYGQADEGLSARPSPPTVGSA